VPAENLVRWKPVLLVGAAILVGVHVFAAVGHGGGGWIEEYGFPAALWDFFDVSFSDPLLTAGVSDFAVLIVAFAVVMLRLVPADERRTPRTLGWLTLFLVFPGLGALLAPLWLPLGPCAPAGVTRRMR